MPPRLVDFHTHFFSYAFFEALAEASELSGSVEERIATVTGRAGIEAPDRDHGLHLKRWLAELDRSKVEHAVSFASHPREASVVVEAAAGSGGRLSPFAVVNPADPGCPDALRKLLGAGLRGAVLFPAMHGYALDGPEAGAVFALLEEASAPAVVHCGCLRVRLRELFGLRDAFEIARAQPLDLVPVASRHPRLPIVVPHFGAGFLRETLMLGSQSENVHVDTSSSHGWLSFQPQPLTLPEVFRRALAVFGPRRILFGTDSSVFPRGFRGDLLQAQADLLDGLGLPAGERELILGGNASRLLGLA